MLTQERDALREGIRDGKAEVRDLQAEVSGVAQDLRELVRAELGLAKAEAKEQAAVAARATVLGAGALMMAFVMVIWVSLTATYALANAVEPWVAALIVTGALGVMAMLFGLMAKSTIGQFSIVPRRTAHSVKEDLSWAKQQLKSKQTSNEGATL